MKHLIKKTLRSMGDNREENFIILSKCFEENNIDKKDYLFALTDYLYNEELCLKAIKSLISSNEVDINAVGDFKYHFIQNAIYTGYSCSFIAELIYYCGKNKHKFNVNHQDEDGDTILHTAIYADDFGENIYKIYEALIEFGFDSSLKDNEDKSIVDAMKYENKKHNKFNLKMIQEVQYLYNEEIKKLSLKTSNDETINKVLQGMGYDLHTNKEILKKELPKLNIKGDAYLLALTDELHNELSCFAALKSLIHFEINRVNQVNKYGYNFIQNAMYAGYSTEFINSCIDAAVDDGFLTHKLQINHQDEDGDTMLHTAIYCNDECVLDISSIYKNLLKHGFDSSIKDKEGRSIIDAMRYEMKRCNKFDEKQINEVEKIYKKEMKIEDKGFSREDLEENKRLKRETLVKLKWI